MTRVLDEMKMMTEDGGRRRKGDREGRRKLRKEGGR